MIAFDNGPANGDYVRYIDDLMRAAAVSAAAGVRRTADETAAGGTWSGGSVDGPGGRSMQAPSPTSGFSTADGPATASTTAAAIAAALMSGEVGPSLRSKLAFAALALGAILVGAGVLWQPVSLPFVVGGIALVTWAVRTLKDGATRPERAGR